MILSKIFALKYKYLLKPLLFLFDPEDIHDFFTNSGEFLGKSKVAKYITKKLFKYSDKILEQNIAGINFKNPIGLSAGFDYNGRLTQILSDVGFGFESVGTITFSEYLGNTKPRLARLPKSQSLLVNKGFKSEGIHKVLNKRLLPWDKENYTVGISIGATNSPECSTPKAQIEDILKSFEALKSHPKLNEIGYIELNISCPNVLGSGSLTTPEMLREVLSKIRSLGIIKPLFIKFQLEIDWELAKELIQIMIEYKVDAIIVANLLKHREDKYFKSGELEKAKDLKGNFSGKPTYDLSNELIGKVYSEFGEKIKIIGVGGVFNAKDAYKKIELGASLVQMITGMIYEGPQVIGQINKGLVEILQEKGFKNISEAVGSSFRK
jgi:dihydroorotate dehydrogenase